MGLSAIYLVLLGILAVLLPPARWALAAMLALSLIAILVYGADKWLAKRGGRRVSEAHLHSLALLGGWPGALVAQQLFRHKTSKESFQVAFKVTVLVNVIATTAVLAALAA